MKILIFAHIPPPHHGQSYMVKLLLDGLGGDCRHGRANAECGVRNAECGMRNAERGVRNAERGVRNAECGMRNAECGVRNAERGVRNAELQAKSDSHSAFNIQHSTFPIECYHVNCRFSAGMEDIGAIRHGKVWLLLRYCFEAIWCRFRYGVKIFYYVPAPGKRAALYRDWIVMLLCRPFFKEIVYHWEAAGLGDWLYASANRIERWITHRLLGRPALSIALGVLNMRDGLWFKSRRVEIVPNGIPDPCPDFEQKILPLRQTRHAVRQALLVGDTEKANLILQTSKFKMEDANVFKVLYLAHCTREKGLFDTLEAVVIANAQLNIQHSKFKIHLTVAGAFLDAGEEKEFQRRIGDRNLAGCVTYAGFVSGTAKERLLRESDCLCFPTFYSAEAQPVSVIEAMAHGMAVVTTRWRGVPELVPPDYEGVIQPQSPAEVAAMLRHLSVSFNPMKLRAYFLAHYSDCSYLASMGAAFLSLAAA